MSQEEENKPQHQAHPAAKPVPKKNWVDGTLNVKDLPLEDRRALLQPNGVPDEQLGAKPLVSRTPKLKRDPKTEPPIAAMFRDRMDREGKGPALRAMLRETVESTGMSYSSALQLVMPKIGFINAETEIRLYREHRRNILASAGETDDAVMAAAERAKTEEDAFFDALATLPANAPKAREIEWIEAHPAMMRSTRNKANGYGSNVVNITADDVLNAPHGLCPSRSAAVQLQHWANNSAKFFEQIMSEAKKKSSDGAGSGSTPGEVEDDLGELEDLLDFGS